MMPAGSPELVVEPLPEPTPPPWTDDGAAAEEGASEPPTDSPPLDRAEAMDMLTGAVAVPFAVVALFRGPHWELTDAEAGTIARPLARALPPAWLLNRVLTASPWAVVAAATYKAIGLRLALDQLVALAKADGYQEVPIDTRPGDGSPRRRGAADNGAGQDVLAGAGGANPGDAEGFGLGLGDTPGRPPGRRFRRGRGDPGGAAPPPAV